MIKIGSSDFQGLIKSFSVTVSDLDSDTTARNAEGKMLRDRIRIVRKLNLEFIQLTEGQMKNVMQAISEQFFTVNYPDPLTGGNRTGTFYVGDRTAPIYRMKENEAVWEGLSFNLIEQ